MKLEQQVTSLELCKKLNELGVKQESYFVWNIYEDHSEIGDVPEDERTHLITMQEALSHSTYKYSDGFYSAFTVAELGELLPCLIVKKNQEHLFWESFKTREENGQSSGVIQRK